MSENQLQKQQDANLVSNIIISGNLKGLTPQQKVQYYNGYCERLGLDPFTKPFEIINMSGKEVLYCTRSGAQQLNKQHGVSHEIKARETVNGCYVVTAQAKTPEGRITECIGAVPIENLKGEALCNAMMKAETKAKRRATLDLLGLGILEENEVDTIPNAQKVELKLEDVEAEVVDEALEQWKEAVNQCQTTAELKNLFDSNKETVNKHQEIFNLFSYRKTELLNAQKSAA